MSSAASAFTATCNRLPLLEGAFVFNVQLTTSAEPVALIDAAIFWMFTVSSVSFSSLFVAASTAFSATISSSPVVDPKSWCWSFFLKQR